MDAPVKTSEEALMQTKMYEMPARHMSFIHMGPAIT
jgi:hypothetical protein